MKRNITHLLAGFSLAVPLAGLMGCEAQRHEDIPDGAHPQPVGASVRDFFGRQARKAEQDDFVIYRYEWQSDGSTALNDWGQRRFNELVPRLSHEPFDIVIQPSDNGRLDEARQRTLVSLIAREGIVNPNDRVVVAWPDAEGLYGEEARQISEGAIQREGAGGGAGGAGGTITRTVR